MSLKDALKLARAKATAMPDYVITVYDEDGICRFCTPNVLSYTGYTAEERIGTHYSVITPTRDMAATLVAREDTMMSGESIEVSVDSIHKDGNTITWRIRGWSVPGDDRYVVLAGRMAE